MSELSQDEMTRRFLEHVKGLAEYWARLPADQFESTPDHPTIEDWRLKGLAFSFLTMLDGAADLPGFHLVPDPHPTSRPYYQDIGLNWWPDPPEGLKTVAGKQALHELWYQFCRRQILVPTPTHVIGEGPERIEVFLNESTPYVIAPVDDPERVEDALPKGWCVGHSWSTTPSEARQPDGRWQMVLWRVDDMMLSDALGNTSYEVVDGKLSVTFDRSVHPTMRKKFLAVLEEKLKELATELAT